ncbi:MAG: hypothetical protein AVDCRST_MAG19-1312, partial [uncultured Thermomicrobiales bacterium]
ASRPPPVPRHRAPRRPTRRNLRRRPRRAADRSRLVPDAVPM